MTEPKSQHSAELMRMFDFTVVELYQNKEGTITERQLRSARVRTISTAMGLTSIIAIPLWLLYIYVPPETWLRMPLLVLLLVFIVMGLLPAFVGFVESYKVGSIVTVTGPIKFKYRVRTPYSRIHEDDMKMKVNGIALTPAYMTARFPDPTGIYRFYVHERLNHILSAEYMGPKPVEGSKPKLTKRQKRKN
ncbi:MAG: hypothetical protein AAF702_33270 [Chloroflexota bacterium]